LLNLKRKYILFNECYDQCKNCKILKIECDQKKQCTSCSLKKIICEKKKFKKMLYRSNTGRYFCYAPHSKKLLYKEYVCKLEDIGKVDCDKCGNLRFCTRNMNVYNNCCGISLCDKNNIELPILTISNFCFYSHHHTLCDVCKKICDKRVLILS